MDVREAVACQLPAKVFRFRSLLALLTSALRQEPEASSKNSIKQSSTEYGETCGNGGCFFEEATGNARLSTAGRAAQR